MVISWPAIVPRLCLNDFKITNMCRKDYLMNIKNLRHNLNAITGQDVIELAFLYIFFYTFFIIGSAQILHCNN